jgi:phosphatidylglycerophosphate synthase
MGLIFPIISSLAIAYYSMDFTAIVPQWVWLLCFFGSFWFQTIDAVDGKHARKIKNCSPIG